MLYFSFLSKKKTLKTSIERKRKTKVFLLNNIFFFKKIEKDDSGRCSIMAWHAVYISREKSL